MKWSLRTIFPGNQSSWQMPACLLLFVFLTTALVAPKAASTVFAIFSLSGIWLLHSGKFLRPERELRWVFIAFLAYFFVGLTSYLFSEQTKLGWSLLGRDARFVAVIAAGFVMTNLALSARFYHFAIAAAGVVTGAVAIVEVYILDAPGGRAAGSSISIVFGHLAAGLFVINAALFLHVNSKEKITYAAGSIFALLAVALSGTRGALLAAIIITVCLIALFVRDSRISVYKKSSLILVVTIVGVLIAHNERFQGRFIQAVNESEGVISGSRVDHIENWPDPPACFNERVFLEWLMDNSIIDGSVPLKSDIKVASGTGVDLNRFDCPDSYLIELHNSSQSSSAWIFLPKRNVPPNVSGGGALLMQGRAEVGLAGRPLQTRLQVDADKLILIEPVGGIEGSTRQLIVMRPGFHVYFVPFLMYPKEYGYEFAEFSIGSRILMWDAALDAFSSSPLIGQGLGAYPTVLEQRALEAEGPWILMEFDHAHNEILTVAADRGLVGLISLLAVYGAPFWLFLRRRDAFGYAGMAFVASIFLSGLTETIFNHSLGITYYSMMVLILATAPRMVRSESPKDTQHSRKS